MRSLVRWAGLAVVAAATVSCGDVVRSNDSSVMLKVNALAAGEPAAAFLLSDVLSEPECTPATDPITVCPTVLNDPGTATLAVIMKDVTSLVGPSTNNAVTVTRYRVVFRRADGRNTPGIDVPYSFDGAATQTIAANGTAAIGFELVRHVAKRESPLVQLNFTRNLISTIADVTFFGTDQVGNDVSAMGSISVDFANFGDE